MTCFQTCSLSLSSLIHTRANALTYACTLAYSQVHMHAHTHTSSHSQSPSLCLSLCFLYPHLSLSSSSSSRLLELAGSISSQACPSTNGAIMRKWAAAEQWQGERHLVDMALNLLIKKSRQDKYLLRRLVTVPGRTGDIQRPPESIVSPATCLRRHGQLLNMFQCQARNKESLYCHQRLQKYPKSDANHDGKVGNSFRCPLYDDPHNLNSPTFPKFQSAQGKRKEDRKNGQKISKRGLVCLLCGKNQIALHNPSPKHIDRQIKWFYSCLVLVFL